MIRKSRIESERHESITDYIKYMKYLLLVAVVSLACASITNTTNFYKTETALPSTFQSYSGFEDIDWYLPNSTSLYYSLYQKVGSSWSWDDKNIPLIIWFSAKPGSSAQLGCFNEIGPFAVSG
jgi:carboxypeptidase C (cathepsin A)